MNIDKIIGSGLTSLASREKLIDELKRLGIKNSEVMNLFTHAKTSFYRYCIGK